MGRPSKYTPEFREEAVRLHREQGTSVAESARRLGLGAETFRKWVRQGRGRCGRARRRDAGGARGDRQVEA